MQKEKIEEEPKAQSSERDIKEALTKYKTRKFGLNEICTMYNVPKPTSNRQLASFNIKAKECVKALGQSAAFSAEIEK
ncbi:hypothetical protein ILUMI_21435 [Ignelater luminosus]|uniref:HTH psq-type domain-containing protein n=1 Tax=Ignelater luminosus TaxID=2038154 RepID=A0A8K0CCE1_IGNLU|nr:hypothetical protein ILUMI_21435 [Ignelater luminosus]